MKATDPRPTMWVGHVVLAVPDVQKTKEFLLTLGLRDAEPAASIGIVELRGGTHILVLPGAPVSAGTEAPFDLMVEDLEAFHARLESEGFKPSAIESSPHHRYFLLHEPGGHAITVNSSHLSGLPV
jgi:catechol 2,3-dioxygenase-like lactoylglutathione lyase family enzyme